MSFTIPNILTFFRLGAAPIIAMVLLLDLGDLGYTVALSIFVIAAVTDYLDGYLARILNQSTALGKVLDPIADKAMIIITLCFLHYGLDNYTAKIIFGVPATLIIFREVFISGLREFIGPQSNLLSVTVLSKWKTALQMLSVGVLLAGNLTFLNFLYLKIIGLLLLWLAAICTVITGVDYFKKVVSELKG
jgi:CDP-diacylglycerol--glycerol-3-phosphate 3-phosphatidyltransferase